MFKTKESAIIGHVEIRKWSNHPLTKTILDIADALVLVMDAEGNILHWNARCESVSGYSSDEVLNHKPWDFVIPPEAIEPTKAFFATMTAGHYPLRRENAWIDKDGNRHNVLWSNNVFAQEDGTVEIVIATGVDISDRIVAEQSLKQSEARFRDFARISADWLWETDEEHRFTFISEDNVLHASTGLRVQDIIGKRRVDFASLETVENKEKWKRHVEDLNAHRSILGFQYSMETPTVGKREILIKGKPFFDDAGAFKGYRGVASDITDRVRADQELEIYREHLETMVEQRSMELQQKAQQLEHALENEKNYTAMQQRFLSLVSHEFRTPLTIIDGSAQRIKRRKDDVTPKELGERGDKIRNAVNRMVELIDTVLYTARFDEGSIPFEPDVCDLKTVISTICKEHEDLSADHTIHVDIEALPPAIVMDKKLINQVFVNLLSNAVKYSPRDPLIEVKGWTENNSAMISVSDHGIVIPEDELPTLFQRFFRASTSAGIPGTGLGLSLCQEFVTMHGGTISVQSNEEKGTTFIVCLPIDDVPRDLTP